jgi:AraC-like DNA-binding protein
MSAGKPGAQGRIVFWPGGSIWIGRAEGAMDFHAHHALQVTLALPGSSVRFREPGSDWRTYETALVPSNLPHAMDAAGQEVALIFAEPESLDGRAIHLRYHGAGVSSLAIQALAAEAAQLAAAYRRREADAALVDLARRAIFTLAGTAPRPAAALDARILRAIELVRERLDQTISLREVADAVRLSPDRFRHLFIEQTGVRFRPYVLWQRMERAVAEYAAGATLTDAAYAGGFADSAHFSRTFRRMFGLPAAALRIE